MPTEPADKLNHRINDLETKLMYLQKDYDALNETVLENTRRLETMRVALDRLTLQMQTQADNTSETRNAEDEKPPHY